MKKQISAEKQNFAKEEQWLLKEKYGGKVNKNFKKDLARIKKGEPVDYVIGFKEFMGCRIDLSRAPLIPRPETEFWASVAIDEIKSKLVSNSQDYYSKPQKISVLDIFSGSGCIGVAVLANTLDNVLCDFADIDKNAVAQIKVNLKNNFIGEKRFKVFQSDIFKKIKNKYDFILANPPYIPIKNKSKIGKSVLKYEPKIALFGKTDGLFYIKRFLADAKKHLSPGGKIFMEFDPPQQKAIEKLLKKEKYSTWVFNKDQFGKTRWVMVK